MFPDHDQAERDGLLACGGDLSLERLTYAYRNGIFPWFNDYEDAPILWWCPNPRMVLMPRLFHSSRRLNRQARCVHLSYSVNRAFAAVMAGCARNTNQQPDAWLGPQMEQAYTKLHDAGLAHSFEVWDQEQLAGGILFIQFGAYLSGETMFSSKPNGSKLALRELCRRLARQPDALLDCQVSSAHLRTLGAIAIARPKFLNLMYKAQTQDAPKLLAT